MLGILLGGLWGSLGALGGSFEDPCGLFGGPWGPLGGPWGRRGVLGDSFGRSLVAFRGSLGGVGGPWGSLWAVLRFFEGVGWPLGGPFGEFCGSLRGTWGSSVVFGWLWESLSRVIAAVVLLKVTNCRSLDLLFPFPCQHRSNTPLGRWPGELTSLNIDKYLQICSEFFLPVTPRRTFELKITNQCLPPHTLRI